MRIRRKAGTRNGARIAALVWVSCAVLSPAFGQAPEASENKVVYDEAFFLRYSVNNAEGMLRLIPGVSAILDTAVNQQERGFGSAGTQVLINGRRFPGKANEINTSLRRISPASVERVELIRGVSGDIAVQSEGILVNLVLKEGASLAASGSWELNARFNDQGDEGLDGLVSYAGNWRQISYSLGLERNLWSPPAGDLRWSYRSRDETYSHPDGSLAEQRPQSWDRDHEKWIYTANLTYDFLNRDRIQLNGFYQTLAITEKETTPFIRFDTAGTETLRAADFRVRDIDFDTIFELSGQYEAAFGPGGFTALVLYRRQGRPIYDYRNRILPSEIRELSSSLAEVDRGEDIFRATYALPIFTGQSLEVGVEGARNTLDQHFRVYSDLDNNGTVEEIAIPTAIAHVQENRAEIFANHKWAIGENLSLDSSLNYEFSEISNNYPFSPERRLSFLKPRLDLRYKFAGTDQLRFLVERTVSQLNFDNFVPSYDVVDQKINAGNPGLEPEKTWIFEAGYERRLADDGGILDARAFYHAITDYIDKIPILDQSSDLVSAQGNIASAYRYGIEGKASVRLGFVGLRDAVLSLRYLRQWSEVSDPFTGEDRRLLDDRGGYSYDVGFRHDLTEWDMSYGFAYEAKGGEQFVSDLTFREYYTVRPRWTAFVERQLFADTSLRFEVVNLFGAEEYKRRTLYVDDVMDGAIRRTERWKETRDVRFAIRLRGLL